MLQGTKKSTLLTRERFELQTLVKEQYAEMKLTDGQFAEHARNILNNPKINNNHVEAARKDFGIPSTYHAYGLARKEDDTLGLRVRRIEAFIRKNFPHDWHKFVEEFRDD